MNNPNPLIPQGSLLEQQAKGKPHLRIALFIVAVHVVFLGLLLMQGCKRETDPLEISDESTNEFSFGTLDSSTMFSSNYPSDTTPQPGVTERSPEPEYTFPEPDRSTMADTNHGMAVTTPQPTPDPGPQMPQTPTPQVLTREHNVQSGETFYTIGKKYGVSTAEIAAANPNVDPIRMPIGQKLIIPPPKAAAAPATLSLAPGVELYQVRSGDTLSKLARERGTTAAAIRQLNGMTTSQIYVGRKIKLPARTNTSAAVNP